MASCNSPKTDKNATIPQSYLDSVIVTRIDSFRKTLNNRTDSLLKVEAQKVIDSIKWRDSLYNLGIYEYNNSKNTPTDSTVPTTEIEQPTLPQ